METTKPVLGMVSDLSVLCGGYCDSCRKPFEGTKRVIHDRYIGVHHVAFCSPECHVKWLRKLATSMYPHELI